ncbi:hypothetical protein [Dactylosporangium sp. NPDC000521]|uniref:hypothetical protein n=1 Tax=Dactylosporangium sp. NPDC000521 TaxID=3363975 RepID=UPI0036B37A32
MAGDLDQADLLRAQAALRQQDRAGRQEGEHGLAARYGTELIAVRYEQPTGRGRLQPLPSAQRRSGLMRRPWSSRHRSDAR